MTGLDGARLMDLLERLVVACEKIAGQMPRPEEGPAGHADAADPEWLGPGRVGELLGCSYGEARQRMLDGRIRAVKDGRWLRCRREWIDEYLEGKVVQPPKTDEVAATGRPRKKRVVTVKAGGIAAEFLRERQK